MTNIPESVIFKWQDAATEYCNNLTTEQDGFYHPLDVRGAYLQGRQDEWVKQREEIERLKGLIFETWVAATIYMEEGEKETPNYEQDYGWEHFKKVHNL